MQIISPALYEVLRPGTRDLVSLYELYSPAITNLIPANATKLWANTQVTFNGNTYEREVLGRGDISRFIDERFNTVTINLSNADDSVGSYLATLQTLEGYRILIRFISRHIDTDSIVGYIGRCEKAIEVTNDKASITSKQDLGSVTHQLPFRIFSDVCQVAGGFKGVECMAGESMGSKSLNFQLGTDCDFSHQKCDFYGNTEAMQLQRFRAASGNFKLKVPRGGAGGAALALLGFRNKTVSKQWSNQSDAPYGKPVPVGYGRTQIEFTPVNHADTGQYIAGQSIVGEGELLGLENVRNITPGFATSFQAYAQHLGKYGTDSSQAPIGFFASADDRHSHSAYIEYTLKGENPDTGENAPTIVGVVLWMKIPVWNGTDWNTVAWTDDPVAITRHLILEPRSLNYNPLWFDDAVAGESSNYCGEPLVDDTGCEDLYMTNTMSAGAGTDFKRYRSTSLIDRYTFRYLLGLDLLHPAVKQNTITSYNPATVTGTSVTPTRRYRRRFAVNFNINEKVIASDFLFKKLFPAARLRFMTSAQGKLQIRVEKPQLSQYLRNNISAGATAIPIEDAKAWKALQYLEIFCLIGNGLPTSETAKVDNVTYSAGANAIPLSTSITGTITATASGATLSGGSTTVQASGTVTIGGSITAGNLVTVTIDSQHNTYTISADDTTATIAAMLATMINANQTINRYIEAVWDIGSPTIITIKSKLGFLNLTAGTVNGHFQTEEVMHVHYVFTKDNIHTGTFKWPLSGQQKSYNRFAGKFIDSPQDFEEVELAENDFPNQALVNKIDTLETDLTLVDNYHQAKRILVGLRYKHREGDFYCGWSSDGIPLLLEEGDVVVVDHPKLGSRRNVPLRLNQVSFTDDHRAVFVGQLYSVLQYPDSSNPRTVSLVSGIAWPSSTPGAVTSLTLTEPIPGTVRGTFTFANSVGGQTARIEVLKAGAGSYVDTGILVTIDATGFGKFEMAGLPAGATTFRVTPVSSSGIAGTSVTGNITVSNSTTITGDVTGGGTGTVAVTIAPRAVTFAKIQAIATNKLLGRSSALSGDIEEISIGTGLLLSGGTISVTAVGSGTVTSIGLSMPGIFSVSGSPVTTSGTITVTLQNQNANSFLGGPTSGGAGAVSFRVLVLADMPAGVLTANQTITLSGDATGSGTTSIVVTLATVNSSPGSFGGAAKTLTATVNGKGLVTALAETNIAIAASQVTSGVFSDSLISSTWATKAYADALVVNLLDDRGNYNASSNLFPSSGGSGSAGAIMQGDLWTISVAGTLGGVAVTAGDVVRALTNTPGQTSSNWAISENNFGYVALNQAMASGTIYVGNGSGIGTAVTPTGDVTISNAGVTAIGALKVTNAMLAGSIDDSKLLQIVTANKVADSALSINVPLLNTTNTFTGGKQTIIVTDGATNSVTDVLDLQHEGGSVTTLFGLGIRVGLKTTAGNNRQAANFNVQWTTATDGSRTAKFEIQLANSPTVGTRFKLDGNGDLTISGTSAIVTASGFSGSGANLTALNAAQLTTGLVPAARITEVIALADLTDVAAKTGSGTTVVMSTGPTIITPTIAKLANLTTNGFVRTSGGDGTLSVDVNDYELLLFFTHT